MMYEFESYFWDCLKTGVAIDPVMGTDENGELQCGVRLRPFGKTWPKNTMILGTGGSFTEATEDALRKASSNRWEPLDFASRPWGRPAPAGLPLPHPATEV